MHSTVKKMNKHVTKLEKDMEEAKDKFEAAQRKVKLSHYEISNSVILNSFLFFFYKRH